MDSVDLRWPGPALAIHDRIFTGPLPHVSDWNSGTPLEFAINTDYNEKVIPVVDREGLFEGYDNRSDERIDEMVVVRDQEGFGSHDIPMKIFTKWSIEDGWPEKD